MEGFTPTFFLQLLIAVGSAGAVYGAIKADLKNLRKDLDEEKRLRESHAANDDETHHDIRGEISAVSGRVSVIEGMSRRA